jgi:serine protease inhibitor
VWLGACNIESGMQIAAAGRDFGLALTGQLVARRDGTVFVSPVSAQLALAMAAAGARSGTRQAMLDVLGLHDEDLASQVSELLQRLVSAGGGTVEIASSLWARQGLRLEPTCVAAIERDFRGQARSLDFGSPAAAAEINRWAAAATHGKIEAIVASIPPAVVLHLVNATYFHGDWLTPFDGAATREDTFTLAGGGRASVPLMWREGRFAYADGHGWQAIALPYRQSTLRMLVVLPAEPLPAAAFAPYLERARLDEIVAALVPGRRGELRLPRFRLDHDVQLAEPLGAMGMAPAFSRGADFSGLSPDCEDRCLISGVQQRTRLEVDEKGTVAAAVTQVAIALSMAVTAERFHMSVDRPFLLAIEDGATGALLFLGVIADPR